MQIPRRFLVVPAVALTIAAVSAGTPAGAQTAQTLSPGQATTLSSSPGVLNAPADGRLNSYGTSVHIEGLAFVSSLPGLAAAPGAQLVVLHLSTAWDKDTIDGQIPVTQQVSVAVQSGSLSAPLTVQDSYPSPDDEYYAAAVPDNGPADLTVSVAGVLPQTFDLRAGHRVGATPAALYRDANQPLTTVQSGAVSTFSAGSSVGTVTGQFGVAYAFLQAWKPYSTDVVPSPDQAYLDVEFAKAQISIPGIRSDGINPTGPLPAGSVKFELPDDQTVTATSDAPPTQQYDPFSGDYYALVPASISSVKVVVQPQPLSIQVPRTDGTRQDVDLTLSAPLTATVTFPPPWTPPAPASSVTSRTSATSGGTPSHRHGSGSFPAWLVAVLLAVVPLGLAAWAAGRRRRVLVAATPLRWPPTQLGPGALRALTAPSPRALPAGKTEVLRREPSVSSAVEPDVAASEAVALEQPAVMIRLLGVFEAEGLVKPIRQRPVRRLLIVLAVTPERALTADELAMVISDRPDSDPKPQSLHSYASRLRSALPAGVLPEAGGDGYRLRPGAVVVDWLALAAVANEPAHDGDWPDRAAGALELVRGRPLEGAGWEGIEPFVRTMVATIERLGRDLARHHLDRGDPVRGEWAVGRAMAAFEGSVGLWQDRLEAAAAGSGYGLERAWADARQALGADSGLLASFYEQTRRRLADQPSTGA